MNFVLIRTYSFAPKQRPAVVAEAARVAAIDPAAVRAAEVAVAAEVVPGKVARRVDAAEAVCRNPTNRLSSSPPRTQSIGIHRPPFDVFHQLSYASTNKHSTYFLR